MSFKDTRCNGYHIEIGRNNEIEYLYIISTISNEKHILEKLSTLSSRLYYTYIRINETYATMNMKLMNPDIFSIWLNRLSHPRFIMMRIIIENSHGHLLNNEKILQYNKLSCDVCSQGN